MTDIILLLLQEVFYLSFTWSFSCDMCIFHHVTQNIPPFTRSTVCVTWSIFSVTGIIFHSASPQEIFFLWDKVIIFSCDTRCTSCKRICSFYCNEYSLYVFQQYFSCHKKISLWERSFGHLRCITFSRQMRGRYNQYFRWHKVPTSQFSMTNKMANQLSAGALIQKPHSCQN